MSVRDPIAPPEFALERGNDSPRAREAWSRAAPMCKAAHRLTIQQRWALERHVRALSALAEAEGEAQCATRAVVTLPLSPRERAAGQNFVYALIAVAKAEVGLLRLGIPCEPPAPPFRGPGWQKFLTSDGERWRYRGPRFTQRNPSMTVPT